MAGHCEFTMLSQYSVEFAKKIYDATLRIRNAITIQCELTTRIIWQDIAISQCYHNPVSSLQQEIYGATLRIRNVITIQCQAYSNKYMSGHCEFAMLSQSSVELTAMKTARKNLTGHCQFAMLSQSSVELTARHV